MAIPSRPKECAKITSVFGTSEFWHTTVYILVSVVNSFTFKTKLTVYLYRSIPQKNFTWLLTGVLPLAKFNQ